MSKLDTFLTTRQIEVLKMRKRGLTQEEIAHKLETSRANISILESRAYDNIRRAKATLEAVNRMEIPSNVVILPNNIITDIPRLILDKADEMGIKIKGSCLEILEIVRTKARNRIKADHVRTPITIEIMPDGIFYVK